MNNSYLENNAKAIIRADDGLKVYALGDGEFSSNRPIEGIQFFRRRFDVWGNHPHVPLHDALEISLRAVPDYYTAKIEVLREDEKPYFKNDKDLIF